MQNKAIVYDLLFRAASETMITSAADPKHLGARIGITAVLHIRFANCARALSTHLPFLQVRPLPRSPKLGPSRSNLGGGRRACQSALPQHDPPHWPAALDAGDRQPGGTAAVLTQIR